jgi:hypothetical protein
MGYGKPEHVTGVTEVGWGSRCRTRDNIDTGFEARDIGHQPTDIGHRELKWDIDHSQRTQDMGQIKRHENRTQEEQDILLGTMDL